MTEFEAKTAVVDYVTDTPLLSLVRSEQSLHVRWALELAERFFGRLQIEAIYKQVKERPFSIESFLSDAFKIANIDHQFDQQKLQRLPQGGPLVFVANHPFGVIDGLALCDLAVRLRGDFRIMIHSMLCQDSDLAQYFLPIDFSETKDAVKNNIRSKRIATEALLDGVPLLIFPSGFVATANHWGFGRVVEAPWTTFAAKTIRDAQATVVPVYFSGQNTRLFHIASHFSEALRSAALMSEITKRFNQPIYSTIGDPHSWGHLETIGNRRELTQFLYQEVQKLSCPAERHH